MKTLAQVKAKKIKENKMPQITIKKLLLILIRKGIITLEDLL